MLACNLVMIKTKLHFRFFFMYLEGTLFLLYCQNIWELITMISEAKSEIDLRFFAIGWWVKNNKHRWAIFALFWRCTQSHWLIFNFVISFSKSLDKIFWYKTSLAFISKLKYFLTLVWNIKCQNWYQNSMFHYLQNF